MEDYCPARIGLIKLLKNVICHQELTFRTRIHRQAQETLARIGRISIYQEFENFAPEHRRLKGIQSHRTL